MNKQTIVLVLRSGGDFSFRDVELISRHITGKWGSVELPRIICLWDKATTEYDLGNIEIKPLNNDFKGTWSRIELYSPEMEKYRPFLYIDLDTAIITSVERMFDLIRNKDQFITLEDFWQKDRLATGLVWFPANSKKISDVWEARNQINDTRFRMDEFLRKVVKPDVYWQQLTDTIKDFKPRERNLLAVLPVNTDLVCFHGKPRIYQIAEGSISIDWVKRYVKEYPLRKLNISDVTVIIPYKVDRGWLKDAINSVPSEVQLLVSQGEGNWPENFNKALPQATGKYIKYLHEDDMLTVNCIEDSIKAINDADFIHGNAIEITEATGKKMNWICSNASPTIETMLIKNTIHSATLMYRRDIFEKIGGFDETLNTAEEFEFNMRCLKAGFKIGYSNSFLAYYRRHPQQKIRTVSKKDKDNERELVKNKYR